MRLIGWICDSSLVGHVEAHWLVICTVGHGFVYWQDIWWLIGWRCVCSLVGDVFAHWLEM